LDVTSKAIMTPEWIASLAGSERRCMALAHQMLTAYARLDPLLHDTCPIAYLLAPYLFAGTSCSISVECSVGPRSGHVTVLPGDNQPNVHFLHDIDNNAVMALVRQQLGQLP
jgi:purine nucleosidase